jgi:hypothetical protein
MSLGNVITLVVLLELIVLLGQLILMSALKIRAMACGDFQSNKITSIRVRFLD